MYQHAAVTIEYFGFWDESKIALILISGSSSTTRIVSFMLFPSLSWYQDSGKFLRRPGWNSYGFLTIGQPVHGAARYADFTANQRSGQPLRADRSVCFRHLADAASIFSVISLSAFSFKFFIRSRAFLIIYHLLTSFSIHLRVIPFLF